MIKLYNWSNFTAQTELLSYIISIWPLLLRCLTILYFWYIWHWIFIAFANTLWQKICEFKDVILCDILACQLKLAMLMHFISNVFFFFPCNNQLDNHGNHECFTCYDLKDIQMNWSWPSNKLTLDLSSLYIHNISLLQYFHTALFCFYI